MMLAGSGYLGLLGFTQPAVVQVPINGRLAGRLRRGYLFGF